MAQRHSSLHSFALGAMVLIALGAAHTALAQTSVFAYQAKLEFDGVPANGQFDFQFKLFDAASGGSQQGATLEQLTVNVTNGDYKVTLDFGASVFTGADRYLEVSYRMTGSITYTTQTPRQQITSTPYAIRSLVATSADGLSVSCSNCVTSSQIQSVQGSQVAGNIAGSQISGTIPVTSVPAGSANYIQNTTNQQANSNFNISGSGTAAGTLSANVVNAAAQYNLGGQRVLSTAGSSNLFVGIDAGNATTGCCNAFFGAAAGKNNTSGGANSFFGDLSGFHNTQGISNSFFGDIAGYSNTTGSNNAFFGTTTGENNTTGQDNAFFGAGAGFNSTTADNNSFFGYQAGSGNTTGSDNAFFGRQAGLNNQTGSNNSFFGELAGANNTIGARNAFFGQSAGLSNTTGSNNAFFGLSAGISNTSGDSNAFLGVGAGQFNKTGIGNTFVGHLADFNATNPTGDNNTLLGRRANVNSGVSNATAIGANAQATTSHTVVLGTDQEVVVIPGKLEVDTLGVAGNQEVCLNKQNRLAPCSSSLRYKTDLRPFANGMSIINRLQPISFTWKDGGMRDLGFGAEDVFKIEPLLVTMNGQGQVEGVKYDRITVVLVNAVTEQQQQLAAQQAQLEGLRSIKAENDELKTQLADLRARLRLIEQRTTERR